MRKREVWKAALGTNGYYEVSSWGRVRRAKPGPNTWVGRLLPCGPDNHGYPHVQLSFEGRSYKIRVHILVALTFIGPCPEGMEVNHKDLVKMNCRALNLEYTTHQENVKHYFRTK